MQTKPSEKRKLSLPTTRAHDTIVGMLSKPEKILLWGNILWISGVGMLGPLFAIFAEKIGGNILEISWAYATYLVVTGIGIIVVGTLGDRIGHKRLMVAGYGLNALATFGYLAVNSTVELFVVQALLGVAFALSNPTWSALYDLYSGDDTEDGYIWGLSAGTGHIVSGVALVIGGFIINAYSFDALFIIMGSILTISTIYQAKILYV